MDLLAAPAAGRGLDTIMLAILNLTHAAALAALLVLAAGTAMAELAKIDGEATYRERIPTPRWTAYDAAYYRVDLPPEVPMTTQERAYTSPIWYAPAS